MRPHERLAYAAAPDRPRLTLPGGARVAVFLVVNVERWDDARPMPRQVLPAPTGVAVSPDLPNWAWHEYGMRVGFWRLKAALDRHAIRPTLSINGAVACAYPRITSACADAGWEFMGHGFHQEPTHAVPDEGAMIAATLDALERACGTRPVGWLGPGLTETEATPDLLAAAGLTYVADWVVDDLPCELRTTHGPLLTMPYSVELNDVPVIAVGRGTGEELLARTLAQHARLLAEAEREGAKIMGLAVHPYLTGVPHRIAWFEAALAALAADPGTVFMQGREIAAWYREATAGS